MNTITIGTCGWSYKDWSGHFYPAGLAAGNYLTHYAQQFSIVEVDSSFYGCPTAKTVEGWRTKTPDGFRFSLKVPQTITHEKMLLNCQAEVEEFLTAVRVLDQKFLCCCLQFGFFNRDKFAGLPEFLERLELFLEHWPKDVQLAVEIRNKTWMNQKLADTLRRYNAVWVLADQAWMPTPWYLMQKLDVVTGPFAYIRLLGDRAEVDRLTNKLDHIVVDRTEQIEADARAISQLSALVPVLTFVNNHYAGYAPETVKQLRKALGLLKPEDLPW